MSEIDMTDSSNPILERGPAGRLHVPRWSKGCYYGRPSACCAACWLRLAWAILRR